MDYQTFLTAVIDRASGRGSVTSQAAINAALDRCRGKDETALLAEWEAAKKRVDEACRVGQYDAFAGLGAEQFVIEWVISCIAAFRGRKLLPWSPGTRATREALEILRSA